ncbi:MAG: hypothetical protein WKG32_08820 [Gemmatimonadaceae bacterium]
MSVEILAPAEAAVDASGLPQRYGTIVVVGGGCYGSYYVRQLARALAAGRLTFDRVLVVDRDAGCEVARTLSSGSAASRVELQVADWTPFFDEYLGSAASGAATQDAIVPSPLMPHLMFEWLVRRARERWPQRTVRTTPIGREPATPWQRAGADATHYVSFAEWMCPVNCVEPPLCPEIRGPRTWSMPQAVRAYAQAERGHGRALAGPVIFHCTHRAFGVGMFDTQSVLEADRAVVRAAALEAADILIATVSHCHGAMSVLGVGAPTLD